MKTLTRDILAPANFVTIAGYLLVLYGSVRLNTWAGLVYILAGRVLDLLDGPLARHTHTSRFGAFLDAAVDKFSILAITIALLMFSLAPTWIVLYIIVQNTFVGVFNLFINHHRDELESSKAGKINMFLQNASMLLFVAASLTTQTMHVVLLGGAYVTFSVSLYYAYTATLGYVRIGLRRP